MDTLSLRWLPGGGRAEGSTKKMPNKLAVCSVPPVLGVFINDEPLDELLSKAAAKNGSRGLGDVFLTQSLLHELHAQRQWLASTDETIAIMLLVCGCGHWECSDISVESKCEDNWVHWRFDLIPVYQEHYGELPEFWFDRKAYQEAIRNFNFKCQFEIVFLSL